MHKFIGLNNLGFYKSDHYPLDQVMQMISGGKFSHFDMIREFPHDQYESSRIWTFGLGSEHDHVVLISFSRKYICLHDICTASLTTRPS